MEKGGEGGTRLFRVSSVQPPSLQPPEPYAPRNAPIPCALIRLRILPVTTGVYPACCLQRFLGALCASVAVHPLPITRVGGGKGARAESVSGEDCGDDGEPHDVGGGVG